MAKITNQAGLTPNNLVLNTVELSQRTTISIVASTATISDSAAEFVTAGFAVGDRIIIRFADPDNLNNGYATIDTVAAGAITVSSETGTLADQSAGAACTIQRLKKTIQFVEAGGLDFHDGVGGVALTSELQTLWDTGDYDVYPFPYDEGRPLAETIRFVEGWELHDADTINALRDSAVEVYSGETGLLSRQYMNVTSPAFYNGTGVADFWQEDPASNPSATITQFVTNGFTNQLVLIYDAETSFDARDFFTAKIAVAGRTPVLYDLLTAQSVTELTAKPYVLAQLSDGLDLELSDPATGLPRTADSVIASQAPYTNITYTRHSPDVQRPIEGTDFDFDTIIARTGATKRQVHEKLNWLIRQKATDIDSGSGTLLGGHSGALSSFVGETVTYEGFADGTPDDEKNTSIFVDSSGVGRRFDEVAAFGFQFILPAGFSGSAAFTVRQEAVFGISGAPIMRDGGNNDIADTITASGTRTFSVKYSTFNQNGHPPGNPISVILSLSGGANGLKPDTFGPFTIGNNTTQVFRIEPDTTSAYQAAP